MSIIVRKPRLEPKDENGVPRDFKQVRDYFNQSLAGETIPYIARRNPITNEEIIERWVPSLDTNISLVAELDGRVVGSGTVFYKLNSSEYSHAQSRPLGSVSITTDPRVRYALVFRPLFEGVINATRDAERTAILEAAEESPGVEQMRIMGYSPNEIIERHDAFLDAGLSGRVYRYIFS